MKKGSGYICNQYQFSHISQFQVFEVDVMRFVNRYKKPPKLMDRRMQAEQRVIRIRYGIFVSKFSSITCIFMLSVQSNTLKTL